MRVPWEVFAGCTMLKLAFINRDGYRSTDFEVHRNWLAVTSLPLDVWYRNATASEWTLDYPPAFAYFEHLLSKVAFRIDPRMVQPDQLYYASFPTVIFQRATVIVSDVTLFLGLHMLGVSFWAQAFVMLNPALLIVDHMHFQYNGFILGLLLMSVACAEKRPYLSSVLFTLLVNMKHIFVYIAPIYLAYFLRYHCIPPDGTRNIGRCILRVCMFGAIVLGVTAVIWAPILWTGQGIDALRRMFPFGRGLTHAYWAPNIWALYSFADRLCAKVLSRKSVISSTQGLTQITPMVVLRDIKPWCTFAMAIFGYILLSVRIWRKKSHLLLHVAQGSALGFACGWHVHEKAILMVIIPLAAYCHLPQTKDCNSTPWERRLYMVLACYATFTCMPLLPPRLLETALKWLLFSFHFREAQFFSILTPKIVHFIPLLGAYAEFHRFGPLKSMEFLPLMMISVVGAVVIITHFTYLLRL